MENTNVIGDKIDLESIDNVLYSDYNGMFEVKSPNSDIQLSFKQI